LSNKIEEYIKTNINEVINSAASIYGGTNNGAFRALHASNKISIGMLHFAGMTALGIQEQNEKLDKLILAIEGLTKEIKSNTVEEKPKATTSKTTGK